MIKKPANPSVQFASGGILWRAGTPRKIAVVHRPRYDDWSLPKGKPDKGEDIAETARREVREEVGCEVEFGDFAGVVHYEIGESRTKVVLFWHMNVKEPFKFKPNEEVDQLLWLPLEEAIEKLSYDVERELLITVRENSPQSRRP